MAEAVWYKRKILFGFSWDHEGQLANVATTEFGLRIEQ